MGGTKCLEEAQDIRLKASVKELMDAGLDETAMEILLLFSAKEKEKAKMRQARGIAEARKNGVHIGRPPKRMPSNFGEVIALWESKRLPMETALGLCGVSESTFFRWVKAYRQKI